jgi:hypothetical protein
MFSFIQLIVCAGEKLCAIVDRYRLGFWFTLYVSESTSPPASVFLTIYKAEILGSEMIFYYYRGPHSL